MIVLERRVAWLFRAALKRCPDTSARNSDQTAVQIHLTKDGLVMHASAPEITVSYTDPSQTGKGVFTFPIAHFAEMEGRNAERIEIAPLRPDMAGARWTHQGRTREMEIPLAEPDTVAKVPALPTKFSPMPSSFLKALDEVSQATASEATKYAISRIQLRGKAGQIVGTDTRQLLVNGGFAFPFTEDVLIPRSGIFGLQPLQGGDDVAIGMTDTHLFIKVGPWLFAFVIDKQGRYPDSTQIIPRKAQAETRFRLDADDAQRFLDNLVRRIKGPAAKENAVTLDLMETPTLRYEIDGRVTEVNLVNSEVDGKRLRMCLNLSQLLRALELRFQEFEIRDANKPIVARDGERIYLSMPLPPSSALPPSPDAFKVSTAPAPRGALVPVKRRTHSSIAVPSTQTPVMENGIDILGEAEGLRDGLLKVAAHAGKILRFLRSVGTQQRIVDFARTSLLALGHQVTHGGKE